MCKLCDTGLIKLKKEIKYVNSSDTLICKKCKSKYDKEICEQSNKTNCGRCGNILTIYKERTIFYKCPFEKKEAK